VCEKSGLQSQSGMARQCRHCAVVSTRVVVTANSDLALLDSERAVNVVDSGNCDGFDYCMGRGSKEGVDGRRLANRDTVVQVPWLKCQRSSAFAIDRSSNSVTTKLALFTSVPLPNANSIFLALSRQSSSLLYRSERHRS